MSHALRLALGTWHSETDYQHVLWALLSGLRSRGVLVQPFYSQAHFHRVDGVRPSAGQPHRHLDSWVMDQDSCLATFQRGISGCDLAIVDGHYDAECACGGSLSTLAAWLDLARLVVVDAKDFDPCQVSGRYQSIDGILLDRFTSTEHYFRCKTTLEAVTAKPVLGGLPDLPVLRTLIGQLPEGVAVSSQICQDLGDCLLDRLDLAALLRLAERPRDLPSPVENVGLAAAGKAVVAVAYDEAFPCHFQETYDALESLGARVNTFSPLRSESLPAGTDLVFLGNGYPARFARELSENYCLKESLRLFAARGGRVYAESGGLAFASQELEVNGCRWPMAGLLPGMMTRIGSEQSLAAREIVTRDANWLFRPGTCLRGYHNRRVEVLDAGLCAANDDSLIFSSSRVIGSLVHLNFACNRPLLERMASGDPSTVGLPHMGF